VALPLRADTVTEVTIGPAVAVGDGFTPVTSLTIAAADEAEIIKHGATATTGIGGTLAAITGADGYYALDLLVGEVDTEGRLVILINDDSLILPLRHEFVVVNANVFDALYAVAGTDVLDVNLTQWLGVAPNALIAQDVQANAQVVADKTGYALTVAEKDDIVDRNWDEDIVAAHGTAATAGFLLRVLGAAISTRINNPTLNAILGVPDAALQDLSETIWLEAVRVLTANTNLNDPTAAANADAVWDEPKAGHVAALSFGEEVQAHALSSEISALNDISTAEVNIEMLDVMNVDTLAELAQAIPATNPTYREAVMLQYMALRNRLDIDTGGATDFKEIYNNAGVVIAKKALTDDGTVYSEALMQSGP